MLPSRLTLAIVWIPHLHTLLILTNHSGGPVPGMWAGLFVCLSYARIWVVLSLFMGLFCFEEC